MKIGISYCAVCDRLIDIDYANHWMAAGIQQKCIAPGSVAKNHAVIVGGTRYQSRAGAFDPGLDREILQLQTGCIPYARRGPRAVEREALSHATAAVRGVSRECAVIGADTVKRVALSSPPPN